MTHASVTVLGNTILNTLDATIKSGQTQAIIKSGLRSLCHENECIHDCGHDLRSHDGEIFVRLPQNRNAHLLAVTVNFVITL